MTLEEIRRQALACNRPIPDMPAFIARLRQSFEQYPGLIHARERDAVMDGYGLDACYSEHLRVLEYILVKDFIEGVEAGPDQPSVPPM